MADDTQQAWFYSKGGQQLGPVTHAELQQKISARELHPGKEMVWNESLPNWLPLAEAKDEFDLSTALIAAPAVPTAPAAKTHPATHTKTEPSLQQDFEPVDLSELGLSASTPEWPGAPRRHYLFAVLALPILWGILFTALASTFSADTRDILNFGGSLLILIITIAYTLKRLTNLDMSRWWFLGNFVPIVNLWIGYRCFACPPGYANHGKMDKAGIILAIVYWLSLIALVLGLVWLTLHLMDRYANDPEFREEVRQALIELREQIEAQQQAPSSP